MIEVQLRIDFNEDYCTILNQRIMCKLSPSEIEDMLVRAVMDGCPLIGMNKDGYRMVINTKKASTITILKVSGWFE